MTLGISKDLQLMAKNWWAIALRGLVAIVFGIMAFAWPGKTAALIVLFFGAYVLIDGVFAFIASFTMQGGIKRWWLLLLEGLLGIILGIMFLASPGFTAVVIVTLIAIWALITGVFEIIIGIASAKLLPDSWLIILTGVLSLVFGFLLLRNPGAGIIAMLWIIGMYAILTGVLLIAVAFALKGTLHQGK